jgi:hypothetical protein
MRALRRYDLCPLNPLAISIAEQKGKPQFLRFGSLILDLLNLYRCSLINHMDFSHNLVIVGSISRACDSLS